MNKYSQSTSSLDSEQLPIVIAIKKLGTLLSKVRSSFFEDWQYDDQVFGIPEDKLAFSNEATYSSQNEEWLDGALAYVENSYDSSKLPMNQIASIEAESDNLFLYIDNPDFSLYKLYELQALLSFAKSNEDDSINWLIEARNELPGKTAFVSRLGNKWLLDMQKAEAAERMRIKKLARNASRKNFLTGLLITVVALGPYVTWSIAVPQISAFYTIKTANPSVLQLAEQAGMTRQGELVFLRTDPKLVSDDQLGQNCSFAQANNDGFVEQGCFVPSGYDPATGRIYLRQMPSDLHAIVVATAAYEMLHPVYASLTKDSGDAAKLNSAIEQNYTDLNDPNINSQVKMFASTEPGKRDDELFSILGTEYYNQLTPSLQSYYKNYLVNPNIEVNDNNQINNLFQNDQNNLQQLQAEINQLDKDANTAYADSVSWANVGNQYENGFNYSNYTREYNEEQDDINQYNSLLQDYNTLVNQFYGQQVSPIQTTQQQASL